MKNGVWETGTWGTSHAVALALAAVNLDVVHRATLRALLPVGRIKHRPDATRAGISARGGTQMSKNVVTEKMGDALKRFERAGWLVRGREFVLVRDRASLLDWSQSAPVHAGKLLALEAAIEVVNAALRETTEGTGAWQARRRELLAIQALMTEGFGQNWSGRGSVRHVPRGRTL